MSSEIGSRVLDWDNLDMLYAGAKNLGVAGTVLVVIKNELLARSQPFAIQLSGARVGRLTAEYAALLGLVLRRM